MLGVRALIVPFSVFWKINCFHATICTEGQGLQPAHNDTVYKQIPGEQPTGLHLSGIQLLPQRDAFCSGRARGEGGREGLHCLMCPKALAQRQQLAPCLCQQALASAECQGLQSCWSRQPTCLQERQPNPALGLTNSFEQGQQKAT